MLLNQGCLLIYTSVGNTWISLLSMLHNCFPESFRLFLTMYRVYVHSAKQRVMGGGPALPAGEPAPQSVGGAALIPVASWHSTLGQ